MIPLLDPIEFAKTFWPDLTFYDKQEEVIYSVLENDETYVPAGNELGKDFVAGFIALWWFCSRRPARVVTTSVKMDQLADVLWGEIRRFIATAKYKLPIQYNHMKIRAIEDDGRLYPNAELVGQVSSSKEGLLGRHSTAGFKPIPNDVPRTLVIFDECSGVEDEVYTSTQTWAHRKLMIGNCFDCHNFFRRGIEPQLGGGDIPRPRKKDGSANGYYRKVIRICAEDSPNVKLARMEQAAGMEPTNTIVVPGVKTWERYQQNRRLWDPILQTIGLDAQFYEGVENLLYPPEWINHAHDLDDLLVAGKVRRNAIAMGVDPAEGGDKTAIAIVDEYGLIELISEKTPDTNRVRRLILSKMQQYGISPNNILLDLGGGKVHIDRLREMGVDVRGVGFGEAVSLPMKVFSDTFNEKLGQRESRYTYFNRRAEMYGSLSNLLDPARERGFALPRKYTELRKQLTPIPKSIDAEGRLKLPPKYRSARRTSTEKSLVEIIGHSPDELDALVLAVHAMLTRINRIRIGAVK